MDLGIKGRAAIVTGAGRDIGRDTARQFLQDGVRVTICGRNAEILERTRAELVQATGSAKTLCPLPVRCHTRNCSDTHRARCARTIANITHIIDR
jgi:NAD(P)-dependent dehydrogenase (short-subunit alcohol dehydrogenase family)